MVTNVVHLKGIHTAGKIAERSLCLRAKCGSVIIKEGTIIGKGYNAPPGEHKNQQRCLRKHELKEGFKSDRTCCVHAEQKAIMDALKNNSDKLVGATLYFTRVDNQGKIIFSGKPYCTICSKMALEAGIKQFVLLHETGIKAYDTKEYNDISYSYSGEQ